MNEKYFSYSDLRRLIENGKLPEEIINNNDLLLFCSSELFFVLEQFKKGVISGFSVLNKEVLNMLTLPY